MAVSRKRSFGPYVTVLAATLCALFLCRSTAFAQDATPTDDDLSAQLSRLLSDDPAEHALALARIIEMGDAAVDALESIVVDPSNPARVRSGAIFALGRIGAERSRTVIEEQWASGLEAMGGAVAIQVAIALAEYGNFEPLREIVRSGDEILGAKAAVQLGLRGDTESLELLQQSYEDESYTRMRPFFAIALGLLGDARGEETLRNGLLVVELRNHCAVALSRCGHADDARFELEFALNDPDPLVRLAALDALISVEPSNLDELLTQMRADSDPRVRERVDEAAEHRRRRRPSP